METVGCQEKRMKFRKFVFWNIFRLEATADEIDVNTIPSFGENESHAPRRRAELLTFSKRKKVVGTARVDCAPRTFTPCARLHSPGTEIDFNFALHFFFFFFHHLLFSYPSGFFYSPGTNKWLVAMFLKLNYILFRVSYSKLGYFFIGVLFHGFQL